VLPGFFDISRINGVDVAAIIAMSMVIPLIGNLAFALSIDRARRLLTSPAALARTNRIAGALLIGVGVVIALS
jgi:threonine/homoserine/homoserine lactone efflux protein